MYETRLLITIHSPSHRGHKTKSPRGKTYGEIPILYRNICSISQEEILPGRSLMPSHPKTSPQNLFTSLTYSFQLYDKNTASLSSYYLQLIYKYLNHRSHHFTSTTFITHNIDHPRNQFTILPPSAISSHDLHIHIVLHLHTYLTLIPIPSTT